MDNKYKIDVYNIKSDKYGIEGQLIDTSFVTAVVFKYNKKPVEIAVRPNLNYTFPEIGKMAIDSYMDYLQDMDANVTYMHK